MARLASPPAPVPDPNGNNDSGYSASNVEETAPQAVSNPNSPRRRTVPQQEERQKVSTLAIIVVIFITVNFKSTTTSITTVTTLLFTDLL